MGAPSGGLHRLARWSESVGVVAVWVMLVLTVVDVVGAKLFAKPLRGSIELIGFAQVVAMAPRAWPCLFVVGRQIELELLVSKLPASVRRGIHVFVDAAQPGAVHRSFPSSRSCTGSPSCERASDLRRRAFPFTRLPTCWGCSQR